MKRQVKLTVTEEVYKMLCNGKRGEATISEYVSRLVEDDYNEPYGTDEQTKKELFMQSKRLDTVIQGMKIRHPEVNVAELMEVQENYDRINECLRRR